MARWIGTLAVHHGLIHVHGPVSEPKQPLSDSMAVALLTAAVRLLVPGVMLARKVRGR